MCYRNSFHIFKIRWDFIRNHNIRHLSFQGYCSGFYRWYCLERGDSLRNHSINFSFDFYFIYCCYWKKGRKGYESCKKLQVLRKNNFKLLLVGLAAALVVTAGGFAGAAIALTQVAYGYAASTMATTVLAGATIGASLALGGCAAYAIANSSSAKDFLDQGNGWTIGITATGGLLGAAGGYLNFANYGYTQYGDKTLSTNYPFGRYYNEKYETITHYDWRGRMWWSKHLTDHGNPNVHSVPHWHIENPHNGGGFNSFWELVKAIISRWF